MRFIRKGADFVGGIDGAPFSRLRDRDRRRIHVVYAHRMGKRDRFRDLTRQ